MACFPPKPPRATAAPQAATPASLRHRRSQAPALPPAQHADCLYLRLPAAGTALFRFLLEARENVAYFTVIDRREALIKVIFSPHMREVVLETLQDMQRSLTLEMVPLPPRPETKQQP